MSEETLPPPWNLSHICLFRAPFEDHLLRAPWWGSFRALYSHLPHTGTKSKWIFHGFFTYLLSVSTHTYPKTVGSQGGKYLSVYSLLCPQHLAQCLQQARSLGSICGRREVGREGCLWNQPSEGSLSSNDYGSSWVIPTLFSSTFEHLSLPFQGCSGKRRLIFTSTHCCLSWPFWLP